MVVPHLKKEDELVHPIIVKSADEQLRRTGRILSKVTQEISREFAIVVNDISQKENNALIGVKILNDFDKISAKIKKKNDS